MNVTEEMRHPLQSRARIPEWLNELGLSGWGVEVGVGTGEYSEHLLKSSRSQRMYSIDPWSRPEGSDTRTLNSSAEYLACVKRLLPYGSRSVVLKMYSVEASTLFRDTSLDFVYIDGDHSYAQVTQDLQAWYPKVAHGGVFAGHDYFGHHAGVVQAVDEFFATTPFHSTVCDRDYGDKGLCKTWYLRKL